MKNMMQDIKGSDKVCGVIGDPIAHTRSPQIHNLLNHYMGQGVIYVPFFVKKENLKEAIEGAHALHIQGLNATMPHKQELFKYVSSVDETAQMVGAINTLVYEEKGYRGYNTDYWGLQMCLIEEGVEWKGKNVAILGSGGAAYAAYVAVAKEANHIYLFNRTKEKAKALAEHMKPYFKAGCTVYGEEEACDISVDLVIQTTGVGMGTLQGQVPKAAKTVLKTARTALDLIYEPAETAFLKEAKAKGCKCINGADMLFYQAVKAFELMHHVKCDEKELSKIKAMWLSK